VRGFVAGGYDPTTAMTAARSGSNQALALMPRFSYATHIIHGAAILGVGSMFFFGPIPQDPAYHAFADTRTIAGVDNFWNVLSNLPFLLAGLFGLSRIPRLAVHETRPAYMALCLGVVLVSLGSAFYHLTPSTPSLIWDRLPMTVAFMALFSMLLDERGVLGTTRSTLWPLLTIGLLSAAYWYWTESRGAGDLRPYALVQFLPIALMPAVLLLFRGRYLNTTLLVLSLVFYAIAKALEELDLQVFLATGVLSGHTMKHLAASLAVLCIICAVPARPSANRSFKPKPIRDST
jgi:predicted membrane channel-forming protein YqfA (hemolysin III family)